MIDHIVIVGAGPTGNALVQRLTAVAPITILDTSETALAQVGGLAPPDPPRKPASPAAGRTAVRHGVTKLLADGTSRLVLEDLLGKTGRESTALVAATGSDRRNVEVCRLGAELGLRPRVAIVIDAATQDEYKAVGARGIVRATLLGDVVEQALRYDGIAMASNVGLGKGDVIEIKVLSSSPAIGRPLAELRAEGWRIAAIYRGDELVIPTGSTVIVAEDRVLLVGDPEILPHVSENLRIGLPDFPLRYGPNIIVYLPHGRDRAVEAQAEVLALKTRALRLVRLHPRAEISVTDVDASDSAHEVIRSQIKQFEDQPLSGDTLREHVRGLLEHAPGLIVARQERPTVADRILGRGGRDMHLCNEASVPILFPAGKPHVNRIVMVTGAGNLDLGAADAAIDLARMLELPLVLLRLEVPAFLAGSDARQEQVMATIRQRAGLHALRTATETRVGNPIAEAARFLMPADLCVVVRKNLRRDSFSSPDVPLRIAHAAPCSTLVITV